MSIKKVATPPNMTSNIPLAVNKRISDKSSNQELFKETAPLFQEALKKVDTAMNLNTSRKIKEFKAKLAEKGT